jgi:exopolyphosphatase/guanosine-5'-triphosphate,3'-diphosphate pyrophosphatase
MAQQKTDISSPLIKRVAAIDIGSNTIKIKIAGVKNKAVIKQVYYKDFPSGLGKNLNKEKIIQRPGIIRCTTSLKKIRQILLQKKVDDYKCIATQAIRVAKNRKEILSTLKSKTGFQVEVISGIREAKLTLQGVLMDFPAGTNFACLNTGGGSTELSFHINGIDKFFFFHFGALNIAGHSNSVETAIRNQLRKLDPGFISSVSKLISVGGSIYNAAYILKKDKHGNFDDLNKFKMKLRDLESIIGLLQNTSLKERKTIPGLDVKRVNSVLPGVLINYFILKILNKKELTISTRSISDGIITELI